MPVSVCIFKIVIQIIKGSECHHRILHRFLHLLKRCDTDIGIIQRLNNQHRSCLPVQYLLRIRRQKFAPPAHPVLADQHVVRHLIAFYRISKCQKTS